MHNRMPANSLKPSSGGTYFWSRELSNDTSGDINQSGNYNYSGGNDWASNSSVPWGSDGAPATSYAPDGSWPTLQNSNYAPSDDMYSPTNMSYPPMNYDPASVPPATGNAEEFGLQAMGLGNNGDEMDANEQWSGNDAEGYADFNDPYLQGLLKRYREKSKDEWQQGDVGGEG
jgi:hypothetical protein